MTLAPHRFSETDKDKQNAEYNLKMIEHVKSLLDLLQHFQASKLFEPLAPERSSLRDDITRLMSLCNGTVNSSPISPSESDALESAKAALTKSKATFHAGLTIYPVGIYMCNTTSQKIVVCRQDQVLELEIDGAAEYAKTLKISSYTDITKSKEGDLDLCIPSSGKFIDMVSKFKHFTESASDTLKESKKHQLSEVSLRIDEMAAALRAFVEKKYETQFPDFGMLLKTLSGTNREAAQDESWVARCLKTLGSMVAFQPVPKQMLGKILGKDAADFELVIASVPKIAGSLSQALPKLRALTHESVNEEVLMDDVLVSLFALLHDAQFQDNVEKTVKAWAPHVKGLRGFMEVMVANWLVKATSTFRPFVKKLLAVEMNMELAKSMLHPGIIGSIDCDEDAKE